MSKFEAKETRYNQNVDERKVRQILRKDPNAMMAARYLRSQTASVNKNEVFHVQGNHIDNMLQGDLLWLQAYQEISGDNNPAINKVVKEYEDVVKFKLKEVRLFQIYNKTSPTPAQIAKKKQLIDEYTDEIFNKLRNNKEAIVFSHEPGHATMVKYVLNNNGTISLIKYNAGLGSINDTGEVPIQRQFKSRKSDLSAMRQVIRKDAEGNPIMGPIKDSEGRVKRDAEGNPIMAPIKSYVDAQGKIVGVRDELINAKNKLRQAKTALEGDEGWRVSYGAMEYKLNLTDPRQIKGFIRSEVKGGVELTFKEISNKTPINKRPELSPIGPVSGKVVMGQRFGNCSERSEAECTREEFANSKTFEYFNDFVNHTPYSELLTQYKVRIEDLVKNPDTPNYHQYKEFLPSWKDTLLNDATKEVINNGGRLSPRIVGITRLPEDFMSGALKPFVGIDALDYPLTKEMLEKPQELLLQSIQKVIKEEISKEEQRIGRTPLPTRDAERISRSTLDNKLQDITKDWYKQLKESPEVPLEIVAAVIQIEENDKRQELIKRREERVRAGTLKKMPPDPGVFNFEDALREAKRLKGEDISRNPARFRSPEARVDLAKAEFYQKKLDEYDERTALKDQQIETFANNPARKLKYINQRQDIINNKQKFIQNNTPTGLFEKDLEKFDRSTIPAGTDWQKEKEIRRLAKIKKIAEHNRDVGTRISRDIQNRGAALKDFFKTDIHAKSKDKNLESTLIERIKELNKEKERRVKERKQEARNNLSDSQIAIASEARERERQKEKKATKVLYDALDTLRNKKSASDERTFAAKRQARRTRVDQDKFTTRF